MRSTEEYLSQFCLINWPSKSNYPHLKKHVSSLSLLWLGQPTRYFVSAPCHVTTLHLATKGEEREGIFNNSRAQDPHSAWSRRGTAQGGEGVWWVGFLTISKYLIKYISFINIKYIYIFFFIRIYIEGKSLKVRSIEEYFCESFSINWPWKSKLPYPHQRMSDGTSEPSNQTNAGYPN